MTTDDAAALRQRANRGDADMIRIVASSLAVTAVLSMAATAPAVAAPSSKPKEIVVVGSKIKNSGTPLQTNGSALRCRYCVKWQQAW